MYIGTGIMEANFLESCVWKIKVGMPFRSLVFGRQGSICLCQCNKERAKRPDLLLILFVGLLANKMMVLDHDIEHQGLVS